MQQLPNDHISKKKPSFAVTKSFKKYLKRYGREISLPVSYDTLKHFDFSIPVKDADGKDTYWETVFFNPTLTHEIHSALKRVYSLLKASGDTQAEEHLHIERIDYCLFGNSKPFRIKIVNNYNEVYDYFYIKVADASRIFGMELEHMLSPYWIHFLIDNNTLAEEHIAGVPGDMFVREHINRPEYNLKKVAKEFVKFNERCFTRLLGDMRSYNFVFDIVQDFDNIQFRIRAIDFDQQSYEGSKHIYLPQFFKENLVFVQMVQEYLNAEVIRQYQQEERSQIITRIKAQRQRLRDLRVAAADDPLSTEAKIKQLSEELGIHHNNPKDFAKCKTMPQIMYQHLKELLMSNQKKM
ncbi:MAG: hypothetical protein IPP72_00295 [Chitinophagaceae bacterium]|nr:hypothetical protein [Chitinophagaceae bacterium]